MSSKKSPRVEFGIQTLPKKLLYQRSASADLLNKDLAKLSSFDRRAEIRQLLWGLSIAASFFAIFGAAALSDALKGAKSLVIVPVLMLVISIIKCFQWSRMNLANERYLLAVKLLELFERDLKDYSQISLKLDFHKIDVKENKIRSAADRNIFASDWLSISGEFADGSRFSVHVSEIRHVKFYKGKVKPKGYPLKLTIAFSKSSYKNLLLTQERAKNLIQVQAPAIVKSVQVKGRVLRINAKYPPASSSNAEQIADSLARLVKMLLLSSYEILNDSLRKSG